MTFLWTDILILPAIFQGFLIALVLSTIKKANRIANYFLAALVICCTITLLGKFLYTRASLSSIPQLGMTLDTIIFLFCPFIFLFLKRLLFKEKDKSWYLHFIPAGTYFLIVLYFLSIGQEHFLDLSQTGEIYILYYFVEGTGLFTNFFYLFRSYRLSRLYERKSNQVLSFNQDTIYFLRVFLLVALLCMICWLVSWVALYFRMQLPYINYTTLWFFVPFLTYVVGYYMLAKPTIFRIELEKNTTFSDAKESTLQNVSSLGSKEKAESKARLSEQEINFFEQKLKAEFEQNKIFLEETLTLYTLSEKLNISANDLSWLLNSVYKKGFYDFVNEFRLKEFLFKIDNQEHRQKTILALALEAGFNSKSTFNKVFKTAMKTTPSAYIKSKKSGKTEVEFE